MTSPIRNFSSELTGLTLSNGWVVVAPLQRKSAVTGGNFSRPYIAENAEGRRAFLKAIDLTEALRAPDVLRAMDMILRAFIYERDLVERCAKAKMDRIVKVWDSGEVEIEKGNPFSLVSYLIFEMADGDVHAHVDFSRGIDVAFAVQTLHDVSVALTQLHQQSIAHQDVKPSNVVVFKRDGAKLGDLGRASSNGHPIDHDLAQWAGDGKYTPPELLYNACPSDWNSRRLGCDAYMFGALAIFLVSGLCIAAEVQHRLPAPLQQRAFTGSYIDVLPFISKVTNEILIEVDAQLPLEIRGKLGAMIRALVEADPAKRGHPEQRKQKFGNPFDLRRYTTELDLLRRKAEAAAMRNRTVV
jgi:serine/threonine protein kinase